MISIEEFDNSEDKDIYPKEYREEIEEALRVQAQMERDEEVSERVFDREDDH